MTLISSRIMMLDHFVICKGRQPINSLFYILEGSFFLTVDGKKKLVSSGNLVSFPNNMDFEREMISPILFYNVQISDNFDLPRGYVHVEDHNRLVSSLEYMTKLSSRNDVSKELINHYLNDIFIQLKLEVMQSQSIDNSIVKKAIEYFEYNLARKISLSEVASYVGISVTGLTEHFKAATSITPIKYLIMMRIKKAESLLCSSKVTLSQIASECGYENAFYLSKSFKKEKGISPKEYRLKYGI